MNPCDECGRAPAVWRGLCGGCAAAVRRAEREEREDRAPEYDPAEAEIAAAESAWEDWRTREPL